jgi:hypothetical protein
MLASVTGQPATVRLRLHYSFSAGKFSSVTSTSRTFDVSPNGVTLLTGLAESIIGSQRDYFGDLHDAILDVEVLTGEVIPFVQVIDNGTKDVTIRRE